MSDADWIDNLAATLARGVESQLTPDAGIAVIAEIIRQAHAAHLTKLDTSGLAERIAEAVFTPDTFKIEQVDWLRTRSLPAIAAELAPVLEEKQKAERYCKELSKQLQSNLENWKKLLDDSHVLHHGVGGGVEGVSNDAR